MSSQNNDNTGVPIRVLSSWLSKDVINSIGQNTNYVNPIVRKNFKPTLMKVSFLLRILEFISPTESMDITAILSDSTHKILSIFKFDPAIVDFENRYHQRMTYNTVNRIIHIKKANLKFMTIDSINKDFKLNLKGALDIVVLEILDFELFLIDEYRFVNSIESRLEFVYDDPEYDQLCRTKTNTEIFNYDDGLINSP